MNKETEKLKAVKDFIQSEYGINQLNSMQVRIDKLINQLEKDSKISEESKRKPMTI